MTRTVLNVLMTDRPPILHLLKKSNQGHDLSYYFFQIHSNVAFLSTSRFSWCYLLFLLVLFVRLVLILVFVVVVVVVVLLLLLLLGWHCRPLRTFASLMDVSQLALFLNLSLQFLILHLLISVCSGFHYLLFGRFLNRFSLGVLLLLLLLLLLLNTWLNFHLHSILLT